MLTNSFINYFSGEIVFALVGYSGTCDRLYFWKMNQKSNVLSHIRFLISHGRDEV